MTRQVRLAPEVAAGVAAAFGLGSVADVALAARGWVSLNVVWRVEAAAGVFAVKEVTRESAAELEAAAAIEEAAAAGGVDAPPVVRAAATGLVTAVVDGRTFRCHPFVDGEVPTETLRREDATAAGRALGRLHALALPPDEVATAPAHAYGRAHWCGLIERGERVGAPWTARLRSVLPGLLAAEARAVEWAAVPRRRIGSHRDVRPDNALRVGGRLLLVDWDGAGPAVAGREVAGALRWWTPFEDDFLAGYAEAAGAPPDLDEGAGEDGGLVWWLEANVRAALDLPGDGERAWAVDALAQTFA